MSEKQTDDMLNVDLEPKNEPIPKSVFDVLRIIQLTLTGLAALFPAIGRIWNLPVFDLIGLTCAALATFLGIYLKADTTKYAEEIGL